MTEEPKNETAICTGVLRFLEKARGEAIQIIDAPDQRERRRQAVELVARSSTERFVMEHTRIESFGLQINDGQNFAKLIEPLEITLPPRLPAGTYRLTIAVGAASDIPGRHLDSVRRALGEWVVAKANAYNFDPDETDEWLISETPTGVPFEVTLRGNRLGAGARVLASRFWPSELETARRARIATALARKCPKLQEAKIEHNATSVLICESDDVALANRHDVSEAIMAGLSARSDIPDVVILVETDRGLEWVLWVVKHGPVAYPEIEDPGPYSMWA